jgi:hypothetical protein
MREMPRNYWRTSCRKRRTPVHPIDGRKDDLFREETDPGAATVFFFFRLPPEFADSVGLVSGEQAYFLPGR